MPKMFPLREQFEQIMRRVSTKGLQNTPAFKTTLKIEVERFRQHKPDSLHDSYLADSVV